MSIRQILNKKYYKYVVKSSKLFYTYIGLFILIFGIMANQVQLETRTSYSAEIAGKEVKIVSKEEIKSADNQIYIYTDKNQKVIPMEIKSTEYRNGVMYLYLNDSQKEMYGNITLEIVAGKRSLLQTVFTKAGGQK